ncbi:hypothetical protein OG379_34045 [Streptomyces sp. NBC_01166]|uniref:hypothetical protein n=1 Tax=Streptomyces sp. NBC_01166 TaxID=2903755 RepID=UPI00386509AD|nr:hypothetical protein OG379_34045 [Streptomyces sp. NBC_01166]
MLPRHVMVCLSRLLAAQRRRLNTPRGSCAVGAFRQAVLVLRHPRNYRAFLGPAAALC